MKLSLIIPCYNEVLNLPLLVDRCVEVVAACDAEILLVNNGSTDNSAEVMKQLTVDHPNFKIVNVEVNQGYGYGILAGLKAAQGTAIGWCHADMQTDPMDSVKGFQHFIDADEPSAIFVKGLRYGRPLIDRVFTIGMSIFETILLRRPMWDINAQPTLFHRDFYAQWKNAPHDFSLDLYAYFFAKQQRLKVKRLNVLFGERAHGVSHWNVDLTAKRKFIKRTVDYSLELTKKLKI